MGLTGKVALGERFKGHAELPPMTGGGSFQAGGTSRQMQWAGGCPCVSVKVRRPVWLEQIN